MSNNHQNKKNSRILLTILLMPFITIAASALLFYMAKNDIVLMRGTQNNGVLLQPPFLLSELPLTDLNEKKVDFDALPKKWRFLFVVNNGCDRACEETLWETRQIRLALGKFQSKVERIFIYIGDDMDKKLLNELQKNHKDTYVAMLKEPLRLRDILKERDITHYDDGRVFVVDPDGFVMMFFDPVTEGAVTTESGRKLMYNYKEVMQDMKHLIKLN